MVKYQEFNVKCECGNQIKPSSNGKIWGYLELNNVTREREQHFICNSCLEKWRKDNKIIEPIKFESTDLGIVLTIKTRKGIFTYSATNILGVLCNNNLNLPSEFWDEVNSQYKIWVSTKQERLQESQKMRLKYCDFFCDDFEKWFNAEDFNGNKYEHVIYIWKDNKIILKNHSIPETVLSQVEGRIKELTR